MTWLNGHGKRWSTIAIKSQNDTERDRILSETEQIGTIADYVVVIPWGPWRTEKNYYCVCWTRYITGKSSPAEV